MTVEEVQNSDSIYSYHTFLKEGKTWNYQEYYHNIWTELEWTKDVSYVIDGTTEKDGKTYYNLYRISEDGKKFYCALREEDRRVWQYSSDESKHMIYDFGMSVGDCYMPSPFEQYYFQLKSIKPKWFHNDQLLNVCFYDMVDETIGPAINSVPVPIVEGVGCRKGWNIFNYLAPRATNGIIHEEEFLSCYEDGACIFTADDFKHLSADDDVDYRPFVEDGKVWKVGAITSGNPAQWVEYFYFSGDTIINEKTCKQMMRQRFVHPDFAVSNSFSQDDSLSYVGAWYEEDKKVYEYDTESTQFKLMYDFSADVNNNVRIGNLLFVLGPRYTGGISGFKGAHREVWECDYEESVYYRYAPWLEGVGGIYGPPTLNFFNVELGDPLWALMSCTVSDEVIYLDDDYEDGATPAEARKRFDFTHTIKTQPKAPGWKSGARATSPATENSPSNGTASAARPSAESHVAEACRSVP